MTQRTASSLADFYKDPTSPYAAFAQEHRTGGSMPINMIRAEQEAFEATDPATPLIALFLGVGGRYPFSWDVGDGWTTETTFKPGDMSLFPTDTAVPHKCRGAHSVLGLELEGVPLSHMLEASGNGTLSAFDALTGATAFRDETIRRTMMQMWAESARSGGTSDLLMDGLMQVLLARLLDKAGALRRPQPTPLLGQADLSHIDEVVDTHLAERITVEDLARALDMPRWTFANAFKAATGDTPHAHVTGKRLDRACDLLRVGDVPLAEVAYATGFASQSHMTDTFRRLLGTTPGKWQTEVRE